MRKLMLIIVVMVLSVTWAVAATVQGMVTDAETGEGIAEATVRFVYTGEGEFSGRDGNGNSHHYGPSIGSHHGQGNGGGNGNNVYTTLTDENGYYVIEEITEGVYTGIARKIGEYPSVRIENIEITGDTTVDFELIPCTYESPLKSFMGYQFHRK